MSNDIAMELRSTSPIIKLAPLLIILILLALAAEQTYQYSPDPRLDTQSDADYQTDELERIIPNKVDYIDDASRPVWFERFARILQTAGRPKATELSMLSRRNVDNSQAAPMTGALAPIELTLIRTDLEFDPDTNSLKSKSNVPEIDSITGLDLNELRRSEPKPEPAITRQ